MVGLFFKVLGGGGKGGGGLPRETHLPLQHYRKEREGNGAVLRGTPGIQFLPGGGAKNPPPEIKGKERKKCVNGTSALGS